MQQNDSLVMGYSCVLTDVFGERAGVELLKLGKVLNPLLLVQRLECLVPAAPAPC